MLKKVFLFISLLVISGCSFFLQNKVPEIDKTPKLNIQEPVLENLEPVEFIVTKQPDGTILFGLSSQNYKSLSINIKKIQTHIYLQKKVIDAYKKYYREDENGTEKN